MEEKRGFVFLPSYYEAIRELPPQERLEIYDALCGYALDGVWPEELGTVARIVLRLIRPTLDQSCRKYRASVENGKKGGNPNFKRGCRNPYYPKDNPEDNQDKDMDKDKDKDMDKDREKEREKEKETPPEAPAEPTEPGLGTHGNVFLSSDALERLKKNFPATWQWHVNRLSENLQAGKELPEIDHYRAILNRAEEEMLHGRIPWRCMDPPDMGEAPP